MLLKMKIEYRIFEDLHLTKILKNNQLIML